HCIDLELPFVFLSGSFRNHARSPPLFEDTGFSLCLQIGVRTSSCFIEAKLLRLVHYLRVLNSFHGLACYKH
ncbi:MAG: hypothetical protein ACKVRP_09740, partial [Bacteroidota bacterium]